MKPIPSIDTGRRRFLKSTAHMGAGLTLGLYLPDLAAQEAQEARGPRLEEGGAFAPNAFVRIAPDNTVRVVIKHLEMGQGTYTGLCTLVAEELDAAWEQVVAEPAPADASRYNNLLWGPMQGTGGSSAMANSYQQLREAGAAARQMIVAAAAESWGVSAADISVAGGMVSSGAQSASLGDLAEAAAAQPVPASVTLKDPADFVLIGRYTPRKDVGKTDGSAVFTQDINLPGMLTAVVAHAPRFGATVASVDDGAARSIPGVEGTVRLPAGVAVLAQDFWRARRGRDALEISWDESNAFRGSSGEMMASFRAMTDDEGIPARNDGDAAGALGDADRTLSLDFEFPYLAHATMEPMNCVVRVDDDGCEVWNGEQMHTGDQMALAALLGLEVPQVKINMLYAGGSFGRRANPQADYLIEAAMIARTLPGTPVKLVWDRENDTRGAYYRPMHFHRVRVGLDDQGQPLAWQHHIAGQSILTGTPFEAFMVKDGVDITMVEGAANQPYRVPNFNLQVHNADIPVPVLWWRSVGSTHTAFVVESMIDELAIAAGADPVDYRMALLADHPRHQGVLTLAAEKAGWGSPMGAGRARGVAVHESFHSFVAQVAEVTVRDDGSFDVDRVICAVDCGVAVNPDIIRAQMEGGIGYGLSPTLMSEITLEDGQVVQSNFHDYEVLRINRMPEIEVHIVPSAEPPTGVGEPGTPVIAPAVANALRAATGQRLTRLPLKLTA